MTENIIHNIENLLNEIEFSKDKEKIKKSFTSLMQIIDDNKDLKDFFDKNVKIFELIKEKNKNEYDEILKHYSNCIKELKLVDIPIYHGFNFEFIDFVDFIYKTNENYNFDYSNGIFRLYDSLIYNLFCNTLSKYPILQENLRPIYDKITNSYSFYYLSKQYKTEIDDNCRMGYYILVKTACINVLKELLKYIKENNLMKNENIETTKKIIENILTNRELEVYKCIENDLSMTVKEYANQLKISQNTMNSHITKIAEKLLEDNKEKGIKNIKKYIRQNK